MWEPPAVIDPHHVIIFLYFFGGLPGHMAQAGEAGQDCRNWGQAFPNTLTYWKSLKYHEIS